MLNKKINSSFLGALLVVGQLLIGLAPVNAQSTAVSGFSDIPVESKYFAATDFLKSKGIVSGYKDGTFKPDQTIKRSEAVKILMLARDYLKYEREALQKISFPDVKTSDWFYGYVQQAFSLGVVKGYDDGLFKPASEINRAESLKVIILSLTPNYQTFKVQSAPYIDVKISDWFAEYADYAKSRQIFEPAPNGKLLPADFISRGDFAESIYRLIYIQERNLPKFPIDLNWPRCKDQESGFVVKVPFDWQKVQAGNDLILWHQDEAGGQVSFARVYPNSAVMIMAKDINERNLTLQQYLRLIDYGSGANIISQTLNGLEYSTIYIKDSGIQDSYFKLSDNSILILYGQVGAGGLSDLLIEEMRYMIGSIFEFSETKHPDLPDCVVKIVDNPTDILSQFRQKILVQKEGMNAIKLLGETKIIFTDTIGIGTGPIDYYYSTNYDLTAKYERNTDTVLAEKTGNTSSF